MNDMPHVAVEQFGEDHWSVLLHAESLARGYGCRIDTNAMRCNPARHPDEFAARTARWNPSQPTVLKDGAEVPGHDSYDCLTDLQEAGFLVWDSSTNQVTVTRLGLNVWAQLRSHLNDDGTFDTFGPATA